MNFTLSFWFKLNLSREMFLGEIAYSLLIIRGLYDFTEVDYAMDKVFKSWLTIIDDYVVPFLRSKTGMYVVSALIFVLFIAS